MAVVGDVHIVQSVPLESEDIATVVSRHAIRLAQAAATSRTAKRSETSTDLDMMTTQQGAALKASLEAMYSRLFTDDEAVSSYFAQTYVQHANGITFDHPQFLTYIRHIRNTVKAIRYSVTDAVSHGDTIADRYQVEIDLKDGRRTVLDVFCFMKIENGKIAVVNESSRVVEGSEAFKALAAAAN